MQSLTLLAISLITFRIDLNCLFLFYGLTHWKLKIIKQIKRLRLRICDLDFERLQKL